MDNFFFLINKNKIEINIKINKHKQDLKNKILNKIEYININKI